MCGSTHSGTLDHLLPQADYLEFSVFSRNLVPACNCNVSRKNVVRGGNPGERILHPYFDVCLSDRLIAAQFANLGPVPSISLRLTVDENHAEYAAIRFHVENVVLKTGIGDWFYTLWGSLYRRPSLIVSALDTLNPATGAELLAMLEYELDKRDDSHGGRNNWNSAFIAGLLDAAVVTWLFGQLTRPGRKVGGAL